MMKDTCPYYFCFLLQRFNHIIASLSHPPRSTRRPRAQPATWLMALLCVCAISVTATVAGKADPLNSMVCGLDISRAVIYDGTDGRMHMKETGKEFKQLIRINDALFLYTGTVTVLTSNSNKTVYALPHLRGSKLERLSFADGAARTTWVHPGEPLLDRGLRSVAAPESETMWDGFLWTGTRLWRAGYEGTQAGELRRSNEGRGIIAPGLWLGSGAQSIGKAFGGESFVHGFGSEVSYSSWRHPSSEECRNGFVTQTIWTENTEELCSCEFQVDKEGRWCREKPVKHWKVEYKDGIERRFDPHFVIAKTLMADFVQLTKGQRTKVPVDVDGKSAVEEISYDGNVIERRILRSSGKEAVFPTNRDAEQNLHWAKPGENSSYVSVDGFWCEKVYTLDQTGKLKGTPQYFAVQWRDDGSIYRGAHVFLSQGQTPIVPDY